MQVMSEVCGGSRCLLWRDSGRICRGSRGSGGLLWRGGCGICRGVGGGEGLVWGDFAFLNVP